MNTSRKGNGKETATRKLLELDLWVVGERRHVKGPGDLLAWKAGKRARLIEVKATLKPYAHFGPADREEMLRYALRHGLVAELAWWKPRARLPLFIPSTEWPKASTRAGT